MSKKEEILDIALKEFAKNGYENTSLEDIAKKCNITKPAIYYHFKNKKHLYNEMFKRIFNKLEFKVANNLEIDLKNYIDTLYEFLDEDISKLLAKELSNEMKNLDEETIKVISIMPKMLKKIVGDKFFIIQNTILSSLINYQNTKNPRDLIFKIVGEEAKIDIKEEIYNMVISYLKGNV
ncbi:TetR/AcrR family transcriptional regulator [Caminibacter mediatlanticus TB-2]|uniref:Ica operon transcriptional regulator IcaR, putative n=1 Tax=Caminibacter mediatlanticus TB-2 TaxID=391592 RepID=A0AAI9AH50_9BACT|nr:TetR/AcrR family transcriptional regulator [Caminibacter mediatlanticus]EDM23515.1 ica operon transcriptional regulator IcaR, putative [Caminibacter mediatlanticus TB-2]QCT94087.1 TetR/AcrR family transcriptional regulator [Caminibacter mediatlanticus TB-2]